ncbi:hypothetical protein GCM10025857_39350 [Alicyclobacillus contaminans]|nr:hypothetical protein GCM10025857_39350 [Alicyclobacillus contaminans]
MSIVGATIKELMDRRGITAYRLAKDTGVSYTGVSKILNGSTKNPQIDVLSTIADYFGVSVDYLLGQSIGALIESRMKEIDMSWDELSKKTGITLDKLKDLDQLQPEPWDYEPNGLIDRLATALEMDRKVLASAYTRQEPPGYDGPRESIEEAFGPAFDHLTAKDEHDIARDLERIMESLESDSALAFDGEPLTDEDKELLRISLENSLRLARQVAKKKFTPKKYRK